MKYIDADNTSTENATPSGQVENLTFEEYLRGVFEINNGIENDPDNLVRIHAPELLKLARKQKQPEVDLEKEILDWIGDEGSCKNGKWTWDECNKMLRYFYGLGRLSNK